VNLPHLIDEVVELTRPRWRDLAQRRGIDINVEVGLDPEVPEILGFESELREALTNLVFNALDAMPRGGLLSIRSRAAPPLATRHGQPPSHLILEVADTGAGMDEETRRRCMEPFFSTKGQRGTGLGLAMVYGTMQRHEGTIEVDSAPGKGTRMQLILPLRMVAPGPIPFQPAKIGPLPSLRVLFVDDEPLLRELIQEALECDGHRVQVADGGRAGLSLFREARNAGTGFDVVITDLGMPDLDGRELTRAIKHESPATPVIMMTGWGSLLQGRGELRAPIDSLLSKPPRMSELQAALAKVLHLDGDPPPPNGR
jgi:CheY-like chemotaxis protein